MRWALQGKRFQLFADFTLNDCAVLEEVLVVGQHHQELLQHGRVTTGHAQHVAPEAAAGAAFEALPHTTMDRARMSVQVGSDAFPFQRGAPIFR